MARVPLIQSKDHPEFAEVIEKYRSGRRGKLINIYQHAAQRATAGGKLVHPLQYGPMEDQPRRPAARGRDLSAWAISPLAHYVLRQHVPSLAVAEGLTREECDALADWRPSKFFTERERRRPRLCRYGGPATSRCGGRLCRGQAPFQYPGRSWN